MDIARQVDIYCERTDPSFWSEPLNALTNLAFLFAAAATLHAWRRAGRVAVDAWLLAALIMLIGAGSFLFHTYATVWAGWLDVLFILAFIYVFLGCFLRRVARWRWPAVAAGLAAYWLFARALTAPFPPGALNGSYSYLPPLAALALLGVWAARRGHASARRLGAAAGVFTVSLALRTIDQTVCDAWPLGTHFLWHCLNAVVLYLAATSLAPRTRSVQ
jgi:hypothetical protein